MKILATCLIFINLVFASEYYAKLEPIDSYKVKASISGKVLYTNTDLEGFSSNNSTIIKIDSKIDEIELKQSLNKLKLVDDMIKIEQKNYDRLKTIKSKSAYEKDSQKLKVITLESTKADLKVKIETLKDSIKNKELVEKSNYIYNISVNKGDYVNPGTLLYEAKDLSKSKLEFYVPISSVSNLETKMIYLDGKKSEVKIDKIYKVADSTHISSYKVKLVLDDNKNFSRLVKIEFK
jgi:hypothetical protein